MQIIGSGEANQAVLANMTPRAQRLHRLESYVDGVQYEGMASWWDDSQPLQRRAPCLVYKIVAAAIASNVDLVLGEGRYPEATTNPGEDDATFDDAALDEASSEVLDRGIVELSRQTRLRSVAKEALAQGQGCGTAVAIVGVRAGGKIFVDTIKAKACEPEFDAEGRVVRLVIEYPYTTTERQLDGSWRVKAKIFRREIDAVSDVTMYPADASANGGGTVNWKPDPAQSIKHNLGFCPVVWYPHLRGCSAVDEIDGTAIHALCLAEIEAHDYAISQRHRAALYSGDPQLCEFGVEIGSNPGAQGRTPGIPSTPAGGKPGSNNEVIGRYIAAGAPARKKGAGQIWQYEDAKSRAEYLMLPADATKVLDDNAQDIRRKIAEALSVVFMDPDSVKFAATVSGKALETLRERQLNRCDQIRDDFADGFLVPVMCMLLRVVCVAVRMGLPLRLPGAKKVAEVLKRFESASIDGSVQWVDPFINLQWGDYFKPDASDEQKMVATTVSAKTADLITRRMAVEKLRRVFNIENVDQAVDALEAEADQHGSLEAAVGAMNDEAQAQQQTTPPPMKAPMNGVEGTA